MAEGHRSDHAVDESTGGHACLATPSIDRRCASEIDRAIKPEQFETQQEAAQLCLPFVRACTGHNFHDDGFRDGERSPVANELDHASVHVAPGRPVVLNPG